MAVAGSVAWMWAVPLLVATPVAVPVALIVATLVLSDCQVTEFVISLVLVSEYVPVAVYCWAWPVLMFCTVAGVTAMETSAAGVTVRVAAPLMLPDVAVIVAEPALMVDAQPVALIVATGVLLDIHVTEAVISAVEPSE